jgi:hypothetical protein
VRVIRQTNSHFNQSVQLPDTASAIFDSSAALGAVVYSSADGHVDLAQAHADPQARAIGLATAAVVSGQVGEYLTGGVLDGLTGLTPGTVYFLDPATPGGLTVTCPTGNGQYVIVLGLAISPTQLAVNIHWAMVLET